MADIGITTNTHITQHRLRTQPPYSHFSTKSPSACAMRVSRTHKHLPITYCPKVVFRISNGFLAINRDVKRFNATSLLVAVPIECK